MSWPNIKKNLQNIITNDLYTFNLDLRPKKPNCLNYQNRKTFKMIKSRRKKPTAPHKYSSIYCNRFFTVSTPINLVMVFETVVMCSSVIYFKYIGSVLLWISSINNITIIMVDQPNYLTDPN